MSLPEFLYNWLFGTTDPFNAQNNTQAIAALRVSLNASDPKTVRVYVAGASGSGHQGSSINLIWRLALPPGADNLNFGFSGLVEAYYVGGTRVRDQLRRAFSLGGTDNGPIPGSNGATVTLVDWANKAKPDTQLDFGFTGGADEEADQSFATRLNTKVFLQLQPYGWQFPEQIQFNVGNPKSINLAAVPAIGGASFNNRIYYQDPSLYNVLPAVAPVGSNQEIVDWITNDAQLARFRIMPVYGLRDPRCEIGNPSEVLTILAASMMAWQKEGPDTNADRRPVILLNFDTLSDQYIKEAAGYLAGGLIGYEDGSPNPTTQKTAKARQDYFNLLDAANRLVTETSPNLGAFQTAANNLGDTQVLFAQLGKVDAQYFNYALFRANLPPIMEGQNTANTANNIGKPYLHVLNRNARIASRYPTTTLSYYNPYSAPTYLGWGSDQLSSALTSWPVGTGRKSTPNPCHTLGVTLLRQITAEPTTGSYNTYFRNVATFFSQATQDKMAVGAAYMQTQLAANGMGGLQAQDADENPLDPLYAKLKEKVVIGQDLNLIPGVLTTGKIPDYFEKLLDGLGATLTFKVAKFEPVDGTPPIEKITLVGDTDLFVDQGVPRAEITVVFTQEDNTLIQTTSFKFKQSWTIPDVPWILFKDLYATIQVQDSLVPAWVELGGEYAPLEDANNPQVKLSTRIPSEKDQWLVKADFTSYPSIDKAFQMAAGVNLVQTLPPPLNTLADLGLANVETAYGLKEKKLDSLSFVIKSNSKDPLQLVGKISLGDLEIQTLIIDPLKEQKASVQASGMFQIGSGEDAGKVTVTVAYPDFVFTGKLTSGVIKFEDMLATFLPDDVVLQLPDLPEIDQFEFSYRQADDALSVSMNLNIDWSFGFPFSGAGSKDLFTLKSVGFVISREKKKNTGNVIARTELFPESAAKVGVEVSAEYMADSNWKFLAKTTKVVDAATIINDYLGPEWVPTAVTLPIMESISVTMLWGKGTGTTSKAQTFEFKAKTKKKWAPIPALKDIFTLTFDMTLGYGPQKADTKALKAVSALPMVAAQTLPAVNADPVIGSYGKFLSDITLWNIHLLTTYEFKQDGSQKFCVTWTDVGLTACLAENTKNQWIATFSLDGESVGSIVEKFVSWATGSAFGLQAPWNILSDIDLSGLEIVYNFTDETVGFKVNIGPIDLGLFTIKAITLDYNPQGNPTKRDAEGNVLTRSKNKVEIKIDGSFVWLDGDDLSWEPDDPSTTPAAPGSGSKYLDLRLLAIGQHVTVDGLTKLRTVSEVIAELETLNIPNPPDVPLGGPGQPKFDAASSWFVAFDFGILKVEKDPPKEAANASSAPSKGAALVPSNGSPVAMAAEKDEDKATYFLSLGIVFNDPYLYALQLSLDGPMAKIFDGLNFQIMYQQYSKNVGRYSAEIALPMIMRKFQVGVASITLPTFAIDIFTNGDFQVDIGFPWKEDFTRSFSVEFMAGPIPVLGSAGFYFGKLSSGSTDKVPATSRGWFNPVIVFGFGAQIGLGKSIEAGILTAGFSLTAFGIIEGVIARWLPYKEPTKDGNSGDLQDGYYFSLTGTIGVQGRLFGSINFAIISAELNVAIKVYVRITFASYEPIPITAKASVDVSLAVKINLGLFKITIHLSFRAEVEATFVLDNPLGDNAPWDDDLLVASSVGVYSTLSAQKRLAARGLNRIAPTTRDGLFVMSADDDAFDPTWSNLTQGVVLNLQGYVAPSLTVAAGDNHDKPDLQEICYVVNFFLQGEKPIQADDSEALTAQSASTGAEIVSPSRVAHAAQARVNALDAMDVGPDLFDALAKRVLQWVIAAGKSGERDPTKVDELVVSDVYLANAMKYLSDTTIPMTPADIKHFLDLQARVAFELKQDAATGDVETPVVFFPAPPGVKLHVPKVDAIKDSKELGYAFGGYNKSTDGYVKSLNDYFNELKVQVEAEDNVQANDAESDAPDGPSIAEYIFGDYFAMIGRLAIQAMRDGLRNYKLEISAYSGKSLNEIIADINAKAKFDTKDEYTVAELFVANQKHKLNRASTPDMSIDGMTWQSPGGKSFDQIAEDLVLGPDVTGDSIAEKNGINANIIAPGIVVTYGTDTYTTQSADCLEVIAMALGFIKKDMQGVDVGDVAALLKNVPEITQSTELLASQSIVKIPTFLHKLDDATTLQALAQKYAVEIEALAKANSEVVNLFSEADDPNLNVPHLAQYLVGDLINEMSRTLGLQHISAQVSRYYLHGLRLPTRFENNTQKLIAEAKGLFAEPGKDYPANLGLFALTGQVIPLPDIANPTGLEDKELYRFNLDRDTETWMSLNGGDKVEYLLNDAHENTNFLQFDAVRCLARGAFLDTGAGPIAPLPLAGAEPSRFPLSTEIPWQPAVPAKLPRQPDDPTTPRPRMWSLPNELINTPLSSDILPTVKPVLARTNQARGTTVDEGIQNFGFGTLVSFKIKRLYADDAKGTTQRTYEIEGAPESEITLLERLLDQLGGNSGSFNQVNLLYKPSSTSSDASGWQSDDPAQSLMGITQTNLSTETRPVGFGDTLTALDAQPDLSNIIGSPNDFLRLLWEASITRQGGYFLNYSTEITDDPKGLPDHAFNDRGEAEVAVMAIFQPGTEMGQRLGNYMNVAITNQPFDLNDAALIAVAVPVDVPTGRDFVPGTDTLASYAADYYMGIGVLAEMNAKVALRPGAEVVVEGGMYQVPATDTGTGPGGDLQAIADHFFTTKDEIYAINAAGASLPDQLDALTAIKLPMVVITIGTGEPGNTFEALSGYFAVPYAELAASNADTNIGEGLFLAGPLTAVTGPVSLAPDVKQGIAGVVLNRPSAQVTTTVQADSDAWSLAFLRQTFSLLGYRIASNPQNPYFAETNWGLPSGPVAPNPTIGEDKVQAPDAPSEEDIWHFALSVPYAKVLGRQNSEDNPYQGVGSLLQFEMNWLDVYGNRVLSQLQDPKPTPGMPQNKAPQITGYADRLLGLSQWPGVASEYRVYPHKDTKAPMLELRGQFDAQTYLKAAKNVREGPQKLAEAGKRVLDQAKAVYAVVLAQLNDPAGVTLNLSTSLVPDKAWAIPETNLPEQMSLKTWVTSIADFLDKLPENPTMAPSEYAFATGLTGEKINTGQIFKLTVELTIARHMSLVAGDLRTVKGMGSTITRVAPTTGKLTDDDKDTQRGLETLAADFSAAFAAVPESGYRLATGADRNVFTGTGNSPVWVIQIGRKEGDEPVSFDILNPNDPTVFAPRPISNRLKSKENTSIIQYKTGTPIALDGTVAQRSFASIDLDSWMRTTLIYVDGLLSPKYVTPADILRDRIESVTGTAWPDALQQVLDAKKLLADNLKGAMIGVYKVDPNQQPKPEQLKDIQEAFRQAMLSSVGQFYSVKAGIQFEAKVNAAIQPQPNAVDVPRIFGDISMKKLKENIEVEQEPVDTVKTEKNISLASPKLDLKFNVNGPPDAKSSPYLSSLVSSTSSDAKSVTLNLGFDGHYIEHEIGRVNGIKDYKPSSWLSLVELANTADLKPLTADLGQFEVPIVLRAFPDTPALINQEGLTDFHSSCLMESDSDKLNAATDVHMLDLSACDASGGYNPLAEITQWAYAMDYSMQVHQQQDVVHGTVTFNIVDPDALFASDAVERDLFDNLAEFVHIYPEVLSDLNKYLLLIDVTTSDETVLTNAQYALQSAATLILWVAETAGETFDRSMEDDPATASALDTALPVSFAISEGEVEIDDVTALEIKLKLTSALPDRVGVPLVEVPGFTCERRDSADPLVGVFVYKNPTTQEYLPAAEGRLIPGRKLVLPEMNILERQDAQTDVYITRNADIISGKVIADPFVYRTPIVSFDSPLHPMLQRDDPLNIATIYAVDPDKPVKRTLQCQLAALYDALLANSSTPDVTLQLSLYYGYSPNPAIPPVRLPVFLMPPLDTALTGGVGAGPFKRNGVMVTPVEEVIRRQVEAWNNWFGANTPDQTEGRLSLELTVMSNLTAQPMPTLKLTGLYLMLNDIQG